MKPKILLITGWAEGEESFAELSKSLSMIFDVSVCSASAVLSDYRIVLGNKNSDYDKIENYKFSCICAWSMGGMLAIDLLRDFAKRFILISSTPLFVKKEDWTIGVPRSHLRSMRAKLSNNPGQVLKDFYRSSFGRALSTQVENYKIESILASGVKPLQAGLEYLEETDLRSQLEQLTQPTLLLHGSVDRIISAKCSEYMNKRLSSSKLLVVDDGEHALPVENGTVVAKYVLEFTKPERRGC